MKFFDHTLYTSHATIKMKKQVLNRARLMVVHSLYNGKEDERSTLSSVHVNQRRYKMNRAQARI